MKCRVIYKSDGQLSIIHPAPKARKETVAGRPAMAAVLAIALSGVDKTIIPVGTVFVGSSNGIEYLSGSSAIIIAGTAEIVIIAEALGVVGNLNIGDLLVLGSQIIDVEDTAVVTMVNPGTEEIFQEYESDDDFLERISQKAIKDTSLEGLPYDDIDPTILPDRTQRDKWRGTKGEGVKVDDTVVTMTEKRQAVEDELDAELQKLNPDPIKALKLQRKLQKNDY